MTCALAGTCGGCAWLAGDRPLAAQREAKVRAAIAALGDVPGLALRDAGAALRDRVDVQVRPGAIGLGALDDGRRIVDIATCPALTPALDAWLAAFRADPPPIEVASARLRVGVDAQCGLWIDCAHADVKRLLDERAWLARTTDRSDVELGPKARRVVVDATGTPKLVDPVRRPWFSTWVGDREVPLALRVADFSQPSRAANRVLVGAVLELARATGARRWLELGAGAGNLTLPLAREPGRHVRAVELDVSGLVANLPATTAVIEPVAASFARASEVATLVAGRDAILADPPRSGLGPFAAALAGLAPSLRPGAIVYVSCHVDALARDRVALEAAGYRPRAAIGVDQFPNTPHAEWVVRFER